jgi:soluble lytic murein transglycosylase
MKLLLLVKVFILAGLFASATAEAGPQSPANDASLGGELLAQYSDFLAAREAFRVGDKANLDRLAIRFARSPLEPYLTYYQLRLDLEKADPAAIRLYLARPNDTPLIDRLRGEWLKVLAKSQQWDAFLEQYPLLGNKDDLELSCYALQARRRTQEQDALVEARKLWFSGEGQPESCTVLYAAALEAGIISQQDVWQRTRLALEAGNISLALQLSAKLPAQQALSSTALHRAYNNPGQYLAKLRVDDFSLAERTVALFALQRLAKQSPQLAYGRWRNIAAAFPEHEQHYFYGWLGYEGARKQDPRALEWYRNAGDEPLSSLQLAWRTRAALRQKNWRETIDSINAMDPQQQREKTWRYWKARAYKALGRGEDADAMFAALSNEYGFYGQLAAEEQGAGAASDMLSVGRTPDLEKIAEVLMYPGIQRALALYRMDLNTEAYKEWMWAVRKFDDRQLLAAAEIARRSEIYDRTIDTAERTVQLHDFNLRYPTPYRTELQQFIHDTDLDEAWVYGLMRQESRFAMRAKSTVGAAGLMQLMPETARWAARQLHLKDFRKSLIHDVGVNLKLGTYYLKSVLSWFDNNPVLASAAYNAGPGRARQWRGDIPLEGAIYIETIPFDETRDYVKKVMSNTVYYSKLFGQPPAPLKGRLGVIDAKNSGNQLAIANEQ